MQLFTLTFHYANNYGAFLQAYALQNKLSDSKILNFIPSALLYQEVCVGRLRFFFPFFWRIVALWRVFNNRRPKFNEYKLLKKTKRYSAIFNIKRQIYSNVFFIVGSDQIWNPNYIKNREILYFLGFLPPSAKRISYAASIGMARWPKKFEKKVIPMLKKFDAISVREESAVTYLKSLGFNNVTCVCDPTIFHCADFYRELSNRVKIPTQKFTFIYSIRVKIPFILSEILSHDVISVNLKKKNKLISVSEWLSYVDHAQFVITDSYHCTVFCLLFHKPFIILPHHSVNEGLNERFYTLLNKTKLEYRIFNCEATKDELLNLLNRPIDWKEVDAILEDWRTYSDNWLKNALAK